MSKTHNRSTGLLVTAAIGVGMRSYALSIGPVAWLISDRPPSASLTPFVLPIYFPLIAGAEFTSPTKALFDGYIHLWAPNVTFSQS